MSRSDDLSVPTFYILHYPAAPASGLRSPVPGRTVRNHDGDGGTPGQVRRLSTGSDRDWSDQHQTSDRRLPLDVQRRGGDGRRFDDPRRERPAQARVDCTAQERARARIERAHRELPRQRRQHRASGEVHRRRGAASEPAGSVAVQRRRDALGRRTVGDPARERPDAASHQDPRLPGVRRRRRGDRGGGGTRARRAGRRARRPRPGAHDSRGETTPRATTPLNECTPFGVEGVGGAKCV